MNPRDLRPDRKRAAKQPGRRLRPARRLLECREGGEAVGGIGNGRERPAQDLARRDGSRQLDQQSAEPGRRGREVGGAGESPAEGTLGLRCAHLAEEKGAEVAEGLRVAGYQHDRPPEAALAESGKAAADLGRGQHQVQGRNLRGGRQRPSVARERRIEREPPCFRVGEVAGGGEMGRGEGERGPEGAFGQDVASCLCMGQAFCVQSVGEVRRQGHVALKDIGGTAGQSVCAYATARGGWEAVDRPNLTC